MTPDDAVAAHALSRGFVDAARLEAARKRLAMLRQAGMGSDLLAALAPSLRPEQLAELRAVAADPGGGSAVVATPKEVKLTAAARPIAVIESQEAPAPTHADRASPSPSASSPPPTREGAETSERPAPEGAPAGLRIAVGAVVVVGLGVAALGAVAVARGRGDDGVAPAVSAATPAVVAPASPVAPPLAPSSTVATAPLEPAGWERRAGAGPSARWGHALAWDAGREVTVLFGGRDERGALDDTWTWDGTAWREAAPGVRPSARDSCAAAYDEARGRLVLHGGASGDAWSDGTWEHDGAAWSWVAAGGGPGARAGHALVYDPARRRVVLFGGVGPDGAPRADLWAWDGRSWLALTPPATNSATTNGATGAPGTAGTGPAPRARAGCAWDARRDALVVHGGRDAQGAALGDTFAWSPSKGWARIVDGGGDGPGPRIGAALVATPSALLLVGGSADGARALGDAWLLDAQRWARQPVQGPAARAGAGLALDVARGRVVLFGGDGGGGETWELAP